MLGLTGIRIGWGASANQPMILQHRLQRLQCNAQCRIAPAMPMP